MIPEVISHNYLLFIMAWPMIVVVNAPTQDFLNRIIPDMRTVVPEILGGASLPVAEGDGDVPVSLQELPLVLLAHHRPHTLTVSPPTSLLALLFCDLSNKTSLSFSLLL